MSPPLSEQQLAQACLELEVFIEGRPVGLLQQADGDLWFQYYPDTQESDFVSLLMPVRPQAYLSGQKGCLHPVFDMNLPEGSLRRALVNRYGKVVRGFNDLALLALVGRNTIGRLSFGSPSRLPAARLQLDDVIHARDEDELLSQLYAGDTILSGVAGAQPKVLATISDEDLGKFSDTRLPSQHAPPRSTFRGDDLIIKTSGRDMPWLAANEYHCLRAAALSGLAVPETRLFMGGQVLAVDRFDRRRNADGSTTFLGAEDFCSLAGLTSAAKYDSSYERTAKTLKNFDGPLRLPADRRSFFQSLVLSCVLRNGDAHLKNFTLLHESTENGKDVDVWLSPAYDICSTNVYITRDMLALTLAGSKRYPTLKALQTYGATACLLNTQTVRDVLDRVHHGVEKAASELVEYGRLYPAFHEQVGDRMLRLWKAGLRSIDRDLAVPGWTEDKGLPT